MVKKVLIATDGSGHARKAVEVGSEIAASSGAEVVLVHVLLRDHLSENLRRMAEVEYQAAEGGRSLGEAISAIPEARFPAAGLLPKDVETPDHLLRAVAEEVLAEAERIARAHGVSKVSHQIEDGKPAARILGVAKDVSADMIVTGARGLSDLEALLVGSVSHKLNHLSPVTCVTVR